MFRFISLHHDDAWLIHNINHLQSALKVLQFLRDVRSPRAEEFRAACDKRFELATIFKTSEELALLHSQVRASLNGAEAPEDKGKQEVSP